MTATTSHTDAVSVGLAGAAAVVGRLRVALVDRRRGVLGLLGRGVRIIGGVVVDVHPLQFVGTVIDIVRVGHVTLLLKLVGADRTSGTSIQASEDARSVLYRAVRAIEPWYDWGTIHVERMEGTNAETMKPGGEGSVRFVHLQWFGLHLGFQIGRTPQKWNH